MKDPTCTERTVLFKSGSCTRLRLKLIKMDESVKAKIEKLVNL